MNSRFPGATFTNPIVLAESGDPWVIAHDGMYYLTSTFDDDGSLQVWSAPSLTGLESGNKAVVLTITDPSCNRQIWAAELHRLKNHWYIYFTASDGVDANHRHYVIAAKTSDPLGEYGPPQLVHPAWNRCAIDGSVLELEDGRLYWLYAADSSIWITPMLSPTQAVGAGVRIARGTQPWEREWAQENGVWARTTRYWLEAPQALRRNRRQFLSYSAGHTATPHYFIGLLELIGDDPMNADQWVKRPEPAFSGSLEPDGSVFSTGHNSFTTSPDGTEAWLVYHAKDTAQIGFFERTARLGKINWREDGTPDFGIPIARDIPIPKPSGEVIV